MTAATHITALVSLCLGIGAAACHAQAWRPGKTVEIVIGTSAGGGIDLTGRLVGKLLTDEKLISTPAVVVNKPGGGQAIGHAYLNQHAGDGHFISVSSPALMTNHISGKSQIHPSDVTPLAQLIGEFLAFAVRHDSRIASGRDLIERLKADPGSVTITTGGVLGSGVHIGLGQVIRAAGIDPKKLKLVVFNSGAEGITAVLGGHVDVLVTAPSLLPPHMQAGKMRALAITGPQRMADAYAGTPTWREQGVDVVAVYWRGLIGPRGMTPAQIAFWDEAIGRVVKTAAWRGELDRRLQRDIYQPSDGTRGFFVREYDELRRAMIDLGLVSG